MWVNSWLAAMWQHDDNMASVTTCYGYRLIVAVPLSQCARELARQMLQRCARVPATECGTSHEWSREFKTCCKCYSRLPMTLRKQHKARLHHNNLFHVSVVKASFFIHTMFSHLRVHAFARSVTVARSSAVQASSSRRQERRWAIVCGSPQSQSTNWASSR